MKHLTINQRIGLLVSVLAFCSAGIAAYNLWVMHGLDRGYSRVINAEIPKLGAIAQILSGLGEGQR
ncbi:MAG TPA: hypothetical protein VGD81_11880, partial [Opitutaceae bacterium]